MKKKGFTLIELLAVIVVLAIIALIATPIVMNTIKRSQKGAAERSADNYIEAVETAVATSRLDSEGVQDGTYTINDEGNLEGNGLEKPLTIEMSGNKPSGGTITIRNGQVTTGTKCTSSDYTETQSTTGTKSGCMKFYAFNDDGGTTFNLLLDHNTTATVKWNPSSSLSNASGPGEVLTQLNDDTASWQGTITPSNYTMDQTGQTSNANYTIDYSSYKARLITANEITQITGNTSWDEKSANSNYYLDTNTTSASDTCASGNTTGCK